VIQVDNSSRKLLPGMTATVDIKIHEAKDVLTIPTMVMQYKPSAELKAQMNAPKINDLQKDEIVLYQIKENKIVPVIVQKGLSNLTGMEIKNGLKLGDEVILQSKGGRRRK
jgi:HlyD family secretion protein